MLKYTVKRLAQSLVTILLIATIVFLLMRCLPTDYYFTEEQLMKFTEEQKYAALEAAGLTDPIGTQLLHFYNDLLHLDFGTSRRIQNGASVVKVIGKKFGVSMRLGLISAGISLLVGIMLGILQTAFKDKVFDWIGTAYTVFVNAVPSLVSYSLVLVFGSKYLGFPTLYSTRNVGPSSVLPIVCLSLASIAGYALWTRRYMVDELTRDYIKLARVKGLSSSEIMFKHVLRNAMVPMVQYIPQSILLTVGGSLLMERFFSVPGMGPLLTDAIQRYDLNVVQTLVILYAVLGIVGVFMGDVLILQLQLLGFCHPELPQAQGRCRLPDPVPVPRHLLLHRTGHRQVRLSDAGDGFLSGLPEAQQRILVRHRQPRPRLLVSGVVRHSGVHPSGPPRCRGREHPRRHHRPDLGLCP